MRRIGAALAAVALAVGLAACTDGGNDGLAEQYREGSNKGFISGDGTIQEIPAADRDDPIVFTGTGVDGETISTDDFAGEVLVLNVWYAACGPCRAEAPLLEEAHADTGAPFVGVNIYDGPEQAASFEETYGITYPSVLAREDAELKLALASATSVHAAPTTLVLDKQGRVAARIVGQLRSASILETLVRDAQQESV